MPPIRFLLRCAEPGGSTGPSREEAAAGTAFPIEIRQLRLPVDLRGVTLLARECRAGEAAVMGRFSPAGLRAELASREGRAVRGWLAWRADGTGALADGCPLGLVAVVEAGRSPVVRSSIAWLLVHPATRRRGVATALVRRAVEDVADRGGREITAETLSSWPAAAAFWRTVAEEVSPETVRRG